MFLLLVVVALGGILTAWGITQIPPLPSGSRSHSILRSWTFYLSLLVGLTVVIGFLVVCSLKPPETSDTFIAWASHFLLICTLVSLSLFLHAIWNSPQPQRGIASATAGIILVGLGSFPLFHPTIVYPIFRSVFIITPSELLACVLFFLVGMSVVIAPEFWAGARNFFATFLPQHPFYSWAVASIVLVSVALFATMPPFFTTWVNRMQGFKTPLLEAQFSSSRSPEVRPVAFWGTFNNWPNELLVEEDIDELATSLSQMEQFAPEKTSDLNESMKQLKSHLTQIGFYKYLETLRDPSKRPHLTELKRRAGCWAMRLYLREDHCEITQGVEKQSSSQLSPSSRNEQVDMVYTNNPVFYGTVAFLFQFSEDFKKAELVLRAGLDQANKPGIHWNAAKAYLNFWLGYLTYNRYHELEIEEADVRALDFFRQAIGQTSIVIEALLGDPNSISKIRSKGLDIKGLDYWRIFSLQAKNSYILVSADSLLNEWSARRYAHDINDAFDARGDYLNDFRLLLGSVGWAKIRFHKDEQEIREGKALLVELEKHIKQDATDESQKWKFLKTIRNQISEADLLLETG